MFLYDQLIDYPTIMGDLNWSLLTKPYWAHLNRDQQQGQEDRFLKAGCFIAILTMAWDVLDGSALNWDKERGQKIEAELVRYEPDDSEMTRLKLITSRAVHAAARVDLMPEDPDLLTSLRSEGIWAHRTFVRDYFATRASLYSI